MPAYGCKPDERDDRDHKFRAAPPSGLVVPDTIDLTAWNPPVMDQEAFGTCTVHAITAAWRYNRIDNDLPDVPLSRAQLYYDAGVIEGDTTDTGRQIRDVVKALATRGAAREELWGYDKLGQQPPVEVYSDALNQMALEYQRVDVNALALRTALFMGHPVVVGVNVYQEFEGDEVASTGQVPLPRFGQTPISAHCVLVGGCDPLGFTFLNSWATWWGMPTKKGYGRFPPGYLEREGSDFWTIFTDK